MAEWLTLLLLIMAIMVPVALLAGFAACDRVFGLDHIDPVPPMIDSVMGKDDTTITLIWEWSATAQKFEFERTDPNGNVVTFDVPAPPAPFDDTSLAPGTSYRYRVRGTDTSGDTSNWSAPVAGATLVGLREVGVGLAQFPDPQRVVAAGREHPALGREVQRRNLPAVGARQGVEELAGLGVPEANLPVVPAIQLLSPLDESTPAKRDTSNDVLAPVPVTSAVES